MGETLVLFGGTFNPVHHGHLIAARAVAEHFGFERVTLVPALGPPHKPLGRSGHADAARQAEAVGQAETAGRADRADRADRAGPGREASAADRLEMVRLAVRGERLLDVSDVELTRQPPSYTVDTLLALRQRHGPRARLFWIVGADMLEDLPNWRRAGEVIDLATVITAARPPWSERVAAILRDLRRCFRDDQVDRLAAAVAPTPLVDISSSDIRRRVREGRSIRYLTADPVVEYIIGNGLYLRQDAAAGPP